jgi:hypothetical protein
MVPLLAKKKRLQRGLSLSLTRHNTFKMKMIILSYVGQTVLKATYRYAKVC